MLFSPCGFPQHVLRWHGQVLREAMSEFGEREGIGEQMRSAVHCSEMLFFALKQWMILATFHKLSERGMGRILCGRDWGSTK